MTMQSFANQVVALANSEVKGITNLELQKVMYFALGSYIKENGINDFVKNLYNEPFEAWPYGPVIRSVYFEHKINGRSKINYNPEYNSNLSVLDSFIKQYLGRPIRELVNKSHEHKLWKENISQIMNHNLIEYKLEDIRDAFIN
jgi:uncharacterized phage-associated protein